MANRAARIELVRYSSISRVRRLRTGTYWRYCGGIPTIRSTR